jgi:RNA polymerase sigma factor
MDSKNHDLLGKIELAKKDQQALNALLKEQRGIVIRVVDQYPFPNRRDEHLQIGMIAMQEAIMKYDATRGRFSSFASQVVRSRLIDYERTVFRQTRNESLELVAREEQELSYSEIQQAMQRYQRDQERELVQLEIGAYRQELEGWGLSFAELVKVSPKQDRLRQRYFRVVRFVLESPELLEWTNTHHKLPIQALMEGIDEKKRNLERGRKYILSMIVLMQGEYPRLKSRITEV